MIRDYKYTRYWFTYWIRHGVPGASRVIRIEAYFESILDFFQRYHRRYGRIYGGYFFLQKYLVVNEPELVRDIMAKDFHIFPDHYHMALGNTRLNMTLFFMHGGDDWKRVRSVITPAFTSGKLKTMMGNISDICDTFVTTISKYSNTGQTVDMRKYFGGFAMDVIGACAYGVTVDAINNPDHPIVVNAKKIFSENSSWSNAVSVLCPPLARFLNLEPFQPEGILYFERLAEKIIAERKAENKNGKSIKRMDFIQLMIDSETTDNPNSDYSYNKNDNNINSIHTTNDNTTKLTTSWWLTKDEMIAQGITFFIAAYDTTSASLTHCIYYLAKYNDCQEKLYEELRGLKSDEYTFERLSELRYLNACIDETLRIAPPLANFQRECNQDYKLGNTGITIPAGTTVEIQPLTIHRDPDFFYDPDEYIPERFLNPTHPSNAYMPFGGGPRACLGNRFALNEMRMCIAKLISKYEFTLTPEFKIDYYLGNILFTPKEVLVKINSRI
ncbi:cytochrome P450 3A8-like [Oppia nitens]|uniref:cytochrome P450 3A8-like n=1 Tax=Oppia nitens TaxID=1686743 RepID=UPI0023DAB3D3|nr:cytochrome P450 3A8-like [Oppia nitens]